MIPRLDGDLLPLLRATAAGELGSQRAVWKHEAAVCVVLAAGGYPGTPLRGEPITGLGEALAKPGALVFHAGTALREGALVTAGGRVLSIVGRGATPAEAASVAYDAVANVRFNGMQVRRDIGRGMG